jgi:hypothetical protein
MGWDVYRYPLRCDGCGRTGAEVVRENDWMQREYEFEGFDSRMSHDPRASRHLEPPSFNPVCRACGEGAFVRRVTETPD